MFSASTRSMSSAVSMPMNKTALITGANRGIGRALAQVFASSGMDLIVHCRRETDAFTADMCALAAQHGIGVERIAFELGDVDAMKAAINKVLPVGRRIDVLVNNAGMAHGALFQMTPMAAVREVFDVNFFAQLELTQLVLRRMVRQKSGVIIHMGSIAGLELSAGNVAYGTSKAALMAFTKTLAAEVASLGIRVNAVAPGLTDTAMAGQMEHKAGARMLERSAMRRMATVQEIAQVVLFLASDAASFVNGQIVRVDGGNA